MREGVLNDRNNIFLPMYYALFLLGTSNVLQITTYFSVFLWEAEAGMQNHNFPLHFLILPLQVLGTHKTSSCALKLNSFHMTKKRKTHKLSIHKSIQLHGMAYFLFCLWRKIWTHISTCPDENLYQDLEWFVSILIQDGFNLKGYDTDFP